VKQNSDPAPLGSIARHLCHPTIYSQSILCAVGCDEWLPDQNEFKLSVQVLELPWLQLWVMVSEQHSPWLLLRVLGDQTPSW
jgi:hypothetical protein